MRQEVFFVMNTFLLYLNNLNVDTWHFTCTNILVKAKICDFAPSSAKVKMSSTSNSCTQDFGVTNENRKLKPKLFLAGLLRRNHHLRARPSRRRRSRRCFQHFWCGHFWETVSTRNWNSPNPFRLTRRDAKRDPDASLHRPTGLNFSQHVI